MASSSNRSLVAVFALPLLALAGLLASGCPQNSPTSPDATPTNTPTITPTPSGGGMRKILFTSERSPGGLFIMDADGANSTHIPNTYYGGFSDFSFSHDGTRIVYVGGTYSTIGTYTMDVDGSNATQLTFGINALWPAFSPDGTKIAYICFISISDSSLFIMNADGSNPVSITDLNYHPSSLSWSPDGSKIAFSRGEIYAADPDGNNEVMLTDSIPITVINDQPSWSPDSSKIAFRSNRDGNSEVYVMNSDGSGQVRLTINSAPDYRPGWSPDGSMITFGSERDGNAEVYTMNADGSNQTNISNHSLNDGAWNMCWR